MTCASVPDRKVLVTRPSEAAFSLLELLAAITIFGIIVVGFVYVRYDAVEQAEGANRDRILRFLAGHQIGYLRLGFDANRNEFEIGEQGGDFEKLGEEYDAYRWSANIEEVVVAGKSEDDDVLPLFESEDEFEDEEEESDTKPVILLRISLRVYREDDGEEGGLSIVTFAPSAEEPAGEEGGG